MGKMTLEEERAAARELSEEEQEILYPDFVVVASKTNPEIEQAWIAEAER